MQTQHFMTKYVVIGHPNPKPPPNVFFTQLWKTQTIYLMQCSVTKNPLRVCHLFHRALSACQEIFLIHVSLFGGYVRAKCQNSLHISGSGHNPFIRFRFYLVTDLFVELIALCNVISSHTHLLIGGRRVIKDVYQFLRTIFQILQQRIYILFVLH